MLSSDEKQNLGELRKEKCVKLIQQTRTGILWTLPQWGTFFFSSYGRTLDLPVYLSHYIKVKSLFPLQKLTMTKGKETRFHQNIKTSNPVHIFCSWRGGSKGGGDDTPLKLLSLKIHVRTVWLAPNLNS